MDITRIGVLTSGGDAPGMNAAIRAVVRTAQASGVECLGIKRGYNGLINGDISVMDSKNVNGIILKGGTILYTARCPEFITEEGQKRARDTCKYLGIQGVIAIGGDGTFRGAKDLSAQGISTIGIPATIDNDIACSHYSIGFDTACNTAIDAIDKLRDTMQAHERCSIVEVMGRHAGHLAIYVGIACGAAVVMIPEKKADFEKDVIDTLRKNRIAGRNHFLVIVAEGVGKADDIANRIKQETGIDTRVSVLGHIQRGGSPTARDRVTASRMGRKAVELILEGKTNRVVSFVNSELVDYDINEALEMKKPVQEDMLHTTRVLTQGKL